MNKTSKNCKDRKAPPVRTYVAPPYFDEDPELTPERWWARRQQQASS